jgi:hypothetical protein
VLVVRVVNARGGSRSEGCPLGGRSSPWLGFVREWIEVMEGEREDVLFDGFGEDSGVFLVKSLEAERGWMGGVFPSAELCGQLLARLLLSRCLFSEGFRRWFPDWSSSLLWSNFLLRGHFRDDLDGIARIVIL